jgi:acylphosphatase
MKKHFTIRIHGQVQGVFFRASTKEKADELGVTGLVRNEPDGSVHVEAEGEGKSLETFIRWCHQGPARAAVEKCDIREGSLKEFSRFIVERY